VFLGSIELPSVRLAVAALILIVAILALGSMLSWLVGRLVQIDRAQSVPIACSERCSARSAAVLTVMSLVAVVSWTPVCHDPWWQSVAIDSEHRDCSPIQARDFLPGGLREIIGSCRAAHAAEGLAQLPLRSL
jgi:hypothetical protein